MRAYGSTLQFFRERTLFANQALGLASRDIVPRIAIVARESPQKSTPSKPISGSSLAVLGSFAGAGSGAAAVWTGGGAGVGTKIRIATSGFGAGGGGGIVPVRFTCCVMIVAGCSTTC